MLKLHGNAFKFKEPPYEYEFDRLPMDLILGSRTLRKSLENQEDLNLLSDQWALELNTFKSISGNYHIYE
jgi:hypothetical protein